MATHSSVLAWRIPWTEEPGGLQSMGSQSQTQLSDLARLHGPRVLLQEPGVKVYSLTYNLDFLAGTLDLLRFYHCLPFQQKF